jgi:cyclopropane-fatty-acyl-phospholipid synthase
MSAQLQRGLDFHYSLSNDFFRKFLDAPTLTYTCCYFETPDDSLEVAAENKLRLVARKLALAPGDRVLDLGCGWGNFAFHAAERHGCLVTAVNLAEEQVRFVRDEVARRKLGDRVEVVHESGTELRVRKPWDKVAVIGMSEHVEDKALLFRKLAEYTRTGGLLLLHSIMCPAPVEKRSDSTSWAWLKESIFPVGMVRPLGHHVVGLEAESFEILDVETLTDHYARTCALWLRKLEDAEEEIVASGIASRETVRAFKLYLAGSAKSFEGNHNHIYQVLARPFVPYSARPPRPLTRRDLVLPR